MKFDAFESVLTTVFDDSNLCINVRWFDVRLKKKLNDSLVDFSMNCESLLSISNFKWIVKIDKNFVINFNDLSFLNDQHKLIVLKTRTRIWDRHSIKSKRKIVSFTELFVFYSMSWTLIIASFDMNSQWII